MKNIEIDEDIYAYLASKTMHIGESASNILRRELGLNGQGFKKEISAAGTHGLSAFLSGPKMRFGNATDKFLALFGEVHRQKPEEFEMVLSIRGRDRVYFARSEEEITRSGRSTQPLQIPGTPYWAMTNSPTPQKKRMLSKALEPLGYSEAAIIEAVKAIS